MAVRLIERGVRMAQVYYAKGDPWDAHSDIQAHRKNAKDSDQPFAAVIKDLKSRGLLGATDDFGFKAVDKPVHVHDLHATILHLMGIDHTKLTYRYSGRDFRLTDVSGTVIHDILT